MRKHIVRYTCFNPLVGILIHEISLTVKLHLRAIEAFLLSSELLWIHIVIKYHFCGLWFLMVTFSWLVKSVLAYWSNGSRCVFTAKLTADLLRELLMQLPLVVTNLIQIMMIIIMMWNCRWIHLLDGSFFDVPLWWRCLIQIFNNLRAILLKILPRVLHKLPLFESAGLSTGNSSGLLCVQKLFMVCFNLSLVILILIFFIKFIVVSILVSNLAVLDILAVAKGVLFDWIRTLLHYVIDISLDLLSKGFLNLHVESVLYAKLPCDFVAFIFLSSEHDYTFSWQIIS